jgi:hypothetical protein
MSKQLSGEELAADRLEQLERDRARLIEALEGAKVKLLEANRNGFTHGHEAFQQINTTLSSLEAKP